MSQNSTFHLLERAAATLFGSTVTTIRALDALLFDVLFNDPLSSLAVELGSSWIATVGAAVFTSVTAAIFDDIVSKFDLKINLFICNKAITYIWTAAIIFWFFDFTTASGLFTSDLSRVVW